MLIQLYKAIYFECKCGYDHTLIFNELPDPDCRYRFKCPKVKKFYEINGFLISTPCLKRKKGELLAKKH